MRGSPSPAWLPPCSARILDFEDAGEYEIATKPRFVCAGAPPPITFVERLEQERGWTFMQIYGLTETAPILTVAEPKPHVNTEGDALYRLKGRAGHPSVGVQLRVVGEGGGDVPWDDAAIGEVAARGNMVFKGYWNQPEETAKVVRDGYFYTGDLATVNEHGYINIVDRAKDVIISGGENISSIEVEDVLYRHAKVLEAAVVGIPSERWGETPLAVIVLQQGEESNARRDHRLLPREHGPLQGAPPGRVRHRAPAHGHRQASRSLSCANPTGPPAAAAA